MKKNTEPCSECIYSCIVSLPGANYELCCQYLLERCEPRGCPAGIGCTRFEQRRTPRKRGISLK